MNGNIKISFIFGLYLQGCCTVLGRPEYVKVVEVSKDSSLSFVEVWENSSLSKQLNKYFRNKLIDDWELNIPSEAKLQIQDRFGNVMIRVHFNPTGLPRNLTSWMTYDRYLISAPFSKYKMGANVTNGNLLMTPPNSDDTGYVYVASGRFNGTDYNQFIGFTKNGLPFHLFNDIMDGEHSLKEGQEIFWSQNYSSKTAMSNLIIDLHELDVVACVNGISILNPSNEELTYTISYTKFVRGCNSKQTPEEHTFTSNGDMNHFPSTRAGCIHIHFSGPVYTFQLSLTQSGTTEKSQAPLGISTMQPDTNEGSPETTPASLETLTGEQDPSKIHLEYAQENQIETTASPSETVTVTGLSGVSTGQPETTPDQLLATGLPETTPDQLQSTGEPETTTDPIRSTGQSETTSDPLLPTGQSETTLDPLSIGQPETTPDPLLSVVTNDLPVTTVEPKEEMKSLRVCDCPCNIQTKKNKYEHLSNKSMEELEYLLKNETDKIKKQLTVNKLTLSSYIRKKTSASDTRNSAAYIGIVGTIILVFVLALLLAADAMQFYRGLKWLYKEIRSRLH